jgi:hypothetical protein
MSWIESNPMKMAFIMSIMVTIVYSATYFIQFGHKELNGLMFALPFIWVVNYSCAGLSFLSERGKK